MGGQHPLHILAIFPPEATGEKITMLLGSLGLPAGQRQNHELIASHGATEVCNIVSTAGGLAIPAHVADPSGLFTELAGAPLSQFMDHAKIYAIELLDCIASKPPAYVTRGLEWTEVLGSDAHHPSGPVGSNFPGSRFTWVKMGVAPTLEGLKLALHDGSPLSICRSSTSVDLSNPSAPVMMETAPPAPSIDPNKRPGLLLERLEIKDAQFCGRGIEPLRIIWNPWLNAIVGGRGSGKSTIVEFLRMVARRESELKGDPRQTFDRFCKVYDPRKREGTLTNNTCLTMIYRRDDQRYRIGWRTGVEEGIIEEEQLDGTWTQVPGAIQSRFPIRLYSQKQVFELSRDPAALLSIIDETIEVDRAGWDNSWAEDLTTFLRLRAEARQIGATLTDEGRLRGDLEDVKRKLAVFEKAGHATILQSYQHAQHQEQAINAYTKALEHIPTSIWSFVEEVYPPTWDGSTFDNDPDSLTEINELTQQVNIGLKLLQEELKGLLTKSEVIVRGWNTGIAASTWKKKNTDAIAAFSELKAMLSNEAGTTNPADYEKLVQRKQEIEQQLEGMAYRRQELDRVKGEAENSWERLRDLRQLLTNKRRKFLAQTLAGNEHVKISVRPYGEALQDFNSVEETFRKLICKESPTFSKSILNEEGKEGLLWKLYSDYRDQPDTTEQEKFEARLAEIKIAITDINESYLPNTTKPFLDHLSSLKDKQPEVFDRLMAWWPEDSLKVEYQVENEWRSISEGSPGQRTAAMLAFLLSYGNDPMVLDQPEDDLDNHLIYDLIVKQLRENKQRRQLIVITHNPNIVVNGDAELVVVMQFRKGQCWVKLQGCLQELSIREEICRVMEGGRDAFARRYKRVMLESTV